MPVSKYDKKAKEAVKEKDGLKNSLVSKNKDVKSAGSPILSQSPSGLRVITAIPSIVYGQAVVTMAKGGAETQTFQIFCEMLEAGVVPSTMTINNVIMELSKRGSYNVAISLLDQIHRYQIVVSTAALNSLFNACDKVMLIKSIALSDVIA